MLRRWWTTKYQLPWTPSNLEDLSVFDLLVEFYEDLFESDKTALYDAARGEDGEIVFEETGDPLIDKWEKELAMGITPDLMEGLGQEAIKSLKREKDSIKRAADLSEKIIGVEDIFDKHLLLGRGDK